MKQLIKRNIFFFYLIITFSISWFGWFILITTGKEPGFFNFWKLLAAFGPSLAGLLSIIFKSGKDGLQKLWRQLIFWRVPWQWYAISLAGPPLLMLIALGIHILLGGEGLIFNDPTELYRVIPVFLLVFFFSVLGEEIGWRGFTLPFLQERFNAMQSSVILGFIWALWHLPLWWIPGDFHQQLPLIWFIIQTMTITILYTWIFNATDGSLLIILLLHTASNTAFGVLPMLPETANGSTRPAWILDILLILATGLIIALNGGETLSQNRSA